MKECQVCKNCFSDSVSTCPNDGNPTIHTIAGEPILEGKYQIECRLGQGGMGVVYRARHAYLKTQLAIKVILPDLVGNDPQLVTRFRQEALAAAAIRHQNVVAVTDYGVIDGSLPFLVMEFVEGESLHDLLARERSLNPERAFEMMSAVCAGVGAAHHQGIVHRDLKPLNIMICSDRPNISQAVKILDFGLAKIKSGELLGSFIQAQTTGLMGSPYYMAPEQWADEEPDMRADIYSLGVMLYQMMTGDVPFKGSSIPAIMKKHVSDPAPTLAQGGLKASPGLELAIAHALAKDPAKRTPTVEAFVTELAAVIHPGSFTMGGTLPSLAPAAVSSLKVVSKPPKSSVFVNDVSVGETKDNGVLLVEGLQSGNHFLRISHHGFEDWHADVVADGQPQEIFAELRNLGTSSVEAIPRPNMTVTGRVLGPMDATIQQAMATQVIGDASLPNVQPRKGISPVILGIGGVFALLLVGAIGITGAYFMGVFGAPSAVPGNNVQTPTPTPGSNQVAGRSELIDIPGGSFTMGRDDGPDNEQPAHEVKVKPFKMDKTEVTNAEFIEFMTESDYKPASTDKFLAHWVNGRPIAGQESMPVRFVNIEDVTAFAAWRSKRDGVKYRLPTEQEWEFAARNGDEGSKYPWGDSYRNECAVLDQPSTEPKLVGSGSCPNKWGVVDLVGNVFEWTGTKAGLYPGSKGLVREPKDPKNMIRGGAAFSKSTGETAMTSTWRTDVDIKTRDKELGFRLVAELPEQQ